MNKKILSKAAVLFSFLILAVSTDIFASHVQGGSITYKSIGGDQYEITLVLYRDCSGAAAPGTFAAVDIKSVSCNITTHIDLPLVAGSGVEVSPICAGITTKCIDPSSIYPGVQEYYYRGIKTLPPCSDWVLSFSLCCRSQAINSIVNPGLTPMYIESTMDNLNFPGNSSPKFTNQSAPFICVGQPFHFNNGSFDINGDTLTYELIKPKISGSAEVAYNAGFSETQPISSSPAATFDPLTGDLFVTPTAIQVAEFAVLVKQWRNGRVIGSVIRDVLVRMVPCTNNDPYLNGIYNTGVNTMSVVAGVPVSFEIPSFDVDAAQTLSLSWNAGITGASFNVSTASSSARPKGVFTWTPTSADVSATAYCFTVTVHDDNCPYNGSQTYPFCINVGTSTSLVTTITSKTDLTCNGECVGAATIAVTGGVPPYSYNWSAGAGTLASVSNLCAGTYMVAIVDSVGASVFDSVTINAPPAISSGITTTNTSTCVACDGTASVSPSGGKGQLTYSWSNGMTTATLSGLCPGRYSVTINDTSGCSVTESGTVFATNATIANFTMVPDSANEYFFLAYNTSKGLGLTYHWDFGDNIISTLKHPTHIYAATGTYTVCLITTSALCGADTLCKTINVGTKLTCMALFNIADDTTSSEPNSHALYNLSYGSNLSYYWKFGDGETSTSMTPSHVYSGNGPYLICLSVYNARGCENTWCDLLIPADSISHSGGKLQVNVFDAGPFSSIGDIDANINSTVSVYPNPFNDNTTFEIKSNKLNGPYTFEMTDVLGKNVKLITGITDKQFSINRNGIVSGIYFYKISNAENRLFTGKVVIK